jgi:hypothetical protein
MNKRKVIEHARNYMDLLAQGIDPISQKAVDPRSIVVEPRLQKCFAFVSGILEELLANGGYVSLPDDGSGAPQFELVRKKVAFRLTPEQRGRVFVARGSVTPISFVNQINRVIDSEAMEKLSVKRINAWLLKNEYIAQTKQPTVITKTVMKPMLKAAKIGIEETETTDPKTGEIKYRIMLTPKAQQFLLDNLDRILEEK